MDAMKTAGTPPPGIFGPRRHEPAEQLKQGPVDRITPGRSEEWHPVKGILQASSSMQPSWLPGQRPAELIEIKPGGTIHARNVRWGFSDAPDGMEKPVFKDTAIDPSKIKDVYFLIEPFAPEFIAAHAMMCYEFEEGGIMASDGSKENRLVVSVEARLQEGQKYSLVDGLKGKFPNVYQLGTWNDTMQKRCLIQGHKIVRYRLNLSPKQKQQLVKNALHESFKDHGEDIYDTVRNNCFNSQIRMLNSVLPPKKQMYEWLVPGAVFKMGAAVPKFAPMLLENRDLTLGDPVITQPDATKYPDRQKKLSRFGSMIKAMSDHFSWPAITTAAGAITGALVGSMIAPGIGTLAGAILGGFSGRGAGDMARRSVHFTTEPAEMYFPQKPSRNTGDTGREVLNPGGAPAASGPRSETQALTMP